MIEMLELCTVARAAAVDYYVISVHTRNA